MIFESRLNKILVEQEIPPIGSPREVAKAEEASTEVGRAADQAVKGLDQIHQTLKKSGHSENKAIIGIIEQINGLIEGLKKGGPLRQNLENLLKIPTQK